MDHIPTESILRNEKNIVDVIVFHAKEWMMKHHDFAFVKLL